ncbi:MAG: hypothetical protein U0457_12685 [Candidatus Sericytochromatia bacterium]
MRITKNIFVEKSKYNDELSFEIQSDFNSSIKNLSKDNFILLKKELEKIILLELSSDGIGEKLIIKVELGESVIKNEYIKAKIIKKWDFDKNIQKYLIEFSKYSKKLETNSITKNIKYNIIFIKNENGWLRFGNTNHLKKFLDIQLPELLKSDD